MLNKVGFTEKKKNQMWAECAATTTKIEVTMTDNSGEPSPYETFYEKAAPYAKHLKTFGEVGIVTNHENKKARGKLEDQGKSCILLRYLEKHTGRVYWMLNLKTKKIIYFRVIMWLGKSYGECYNAKRNTRLCKRSMMMIMMIFSRVEARLDKKKMQKKTWHGPEKRDGGGKRE